MSTLHYLYEKAADELAKCKAEIAKRDAEIGRLRQALAAVGKQNRLRGYPTAFEWLDLVEIARAALESK